MKNHALEAYKEIYKDHSEDKDTFISVAVAKLGVKPISASNKYYYLKRSGGLADKVIALPDEDEPPGLDEGDKKFLNAGVRRQVKTSSYAFKLFGKPISELTPAELSKYRSKINRRQYLRTHRGVTTTQNRIFEGANKKATLSFKMFDKPFKELNQDQKREYWHNIKVKNYSSSTLTKKSILTKLWRDGHINDAELKLLL